MNYHKLRAAIGNLFFPRNLNCIVCQGECFSSICPKCESSLPSRPLVRKDIELIESLNAPFEYDEPLRQLIHEFKYDNKRYLAYFFAKYMLEYIPKSSIIVPVPLHKNRRRMRGYSQTHLLCEALLSFYPFDYAPKALLRIRNTPSQTQLNAAERKENLRDAIICKANFRSRQICLIDDVASTGSTLHESAKALINAGAKEVFACTIAG